MEEPRKNPNDDWRLWMEVQPPCFYCKHLTNSGTQDLRAPGWRCKAYPDQIPFAILARLEDHEEHLPSQEGDFVFESRVMDSAQGPCEITFDGEWLLQNPDGSVEPMFPDPEEDQEEGVITPEEAHNPTE